MFNIDNKLYERIFFICLFLFVLFIQGAIPFFALPTLGQAIWSTGFAQSFANYSLLTVYAYNIGGPSPAAMAFGLAGAWPIGGLIKLGLHPADAYSSVAAFWLGIAYYSAYKIPRFFGVKSIHSTLLAGLWLTMPIIWAHATYSMLSWGIALLSFYFYRTIKLLSSNLAFKLNTIYCVFLYFISIIISIFMDGYSFMMFAIGASILIAYIFLFKPICRRSILFAVFPIHLLSFSLSYFLYVKYIGRSKFEVMPIDFFRGWGLDLEFIAIPSKGILWLFDILGLSIERTKELYFGDESVWITTFCLPIILVGIFSWWNSRKVSNLSSGLLIIAIFAFYMSLGPSLKINSTRTVDMLQAVPKNMTPLMSSELAIMPTGSAWISENITGFNAMRASYRWSALGIFAFWLIFSLYLGKRSPRNNFAVAAAIAALILCNTPNLYNSWKEYRSYRTMFMRIDNELIAKLRDIVSPDELVAFLPYKNDFIVNYLASTLNIKTYNIGGDKNLEKAQSKWPALMLDSNITLNEKIINLLLNKHTDTVIIPYFDTLWAAHYWPCGNSEKSLVDKAKYLDNLIASKKFDCLYPKKKELYFLVNEMKSLPYLSVIETDLFVAIKINPEFLVGNKLIDVKNKIIGNEVNKVNYPIVISPKLYGLSFMLNNWNNIEPNAVWSTDKSIINLPVPNKCKNSKCNAVFDFEVLNANVISPVIVKFSTQNGMLPWSRKLTLTRPALNEVSIPLLADSDFLTVTIEVIGATSPQKLGINNDERTLGIRLYRIDLKEE
ncbi:hypothetical protein [Yersinia bercovieri]|uniref:hypothetical protein n=1 Tax=Yersinia bercovieri TaxID=634 RepID=UPI000708FD21|nr:hypothetical protein [Yersinia bercovieri]